MKYLTTKNFLIAASVLVIWALFLYNSDRPQDSQSSNDQSEQHEEMQGEPSVYSVILDNAKQDPISAQVKIGDFIEFSGDDGQQHQIIQSGEGEHGEEELDSGVLEPGQAYRVRFSDEGSFVLGDTFNPDLRINVMVTK